MSGLSRLVILTALGAFASLQTACDQLPGKPSPEEKYVPPNEVHDFAILYQQNCRACHSDGNGLAASINLADPTYLQFVDRAVLRQVIGEGIEGTTMPGFSEAEGGPFTDKQLEIVVQGILDWGNKEPRPADMPPYHGLDAGKPSAKPSSPTESQSASSTTPMTAAGKTEKPKTVGDIAAGKQVYAAACASCHGPDGSGLEGKAGSIVNPDYLRLVSDQYLRTVIVVGRPELGHPGYKDLPGGEVLTSEDVTNLVAWLTSLRQPEIGSLPPPNPDQP